MTLDLFCSFMEDNVQSVEETGGDMLLRLFAKMAQETKIEMGITLTVRGLVVSGLLVGRDRWLDHFTELISQAGEVASGIGTGLQEAYRQSDLQRSSGDDVEYGYLHLLNAKYFLGGQETVPGSGSVIWRGRISEVSGWSIGSVGSAR